MLGTGGVNEGIVTGKRVCQGIGGVNFHNYNKGMDMLWNSWCQCCVVMLKLVYWGAGDVD